MNENEVIPGRPGSHTFEGVMALLGAGVILFIGAPLIHLILATSLGELTRTMAEKQVLQSVRLTLTAALLATVVVSLFGVPLGYLLARKRFRGRALLMAIVDLPVIIPHSVAGIALLMVIGRHSLLGRLFGTTLVGTTAGISVAMAFVSTPFLVNAAHQAFTAVPPRLEKVAQTLGASPAHVFFTVSLPLAWRGIASGMIMMWARGISEFGAVVIIAYHPMTTPVMVFQRFTDFGLAHARAVAVLLIIICVGLFAILRLLSGSGDK